MTDTIYVSNTTGLQTLDTFSPAEIHSIAYEITTATNTDVSVTTVHVTHDGVNTAEYQLSQSLSNNQPLEFVTDISSSTGRLRANVVTAQTTFKISRTDVLCNVYSENTPSGRMIFGNTGFGMSIVASANNLTVRQANNKVFTAPNTYLSANVLGPIASGPALLSSNWISYNNNELSTNGEYLVATTSSFTENFQYQEISVEVGRAYSVSANIFFTNPDTINALEYVNLSRGIPALRVGSALGGSDLFDYQCTNTETAVSTTFIPTTNSIFVSFGSGLINSQVFVRNIKCNEAVPFHTYEQFNGTVYVKWSAVAAGNTLLKFDTADTASYRSISIDGSNNVIITQGDNSVNCGSQSATNKLAFTYTNTSIVASLNGGAVVSNTTSSFNGVKTCTFTSLPTEFSSVPALLSNTRIVEIST